MKLCHKLKDIIPLQWNEFAASESVCSSLEFKEGALVGLFISSWNGGICF